MDPNKNYYSELGIDKNASDEDIKKAFRKLAIQHHPDKSKDDGKKFQVINEAYQILSDPKSKQEYDVRSPHGKNYSPFQSPFEFSFGHNTGFGGFGFDPFEIFNEMFNNGYQGFANFRQKEELRENLNVQTNIDITLKDVYLDTPVTIKYQKQVKCSLCNGTGVNNSSESHECEVCDGRGKDMQGFRCEFCQGQGRVYAEKCGKCNGDRTELKESSVTLNSVHAIRRNSHNEHGGYGHQSKYFKDKSGNLILDIRFIPNEKYEIRESNLYTQLDVHFQDAIDGGDIPYTHVDDSEFKVKLPKKTKDGEYIRIKEKGLYKNNKKERGDLYLRINIIINYDRLV